MDQFTQNHTLFPYVSEYERFLAATDTRGCKPHPKRLVRALRESGDWTESGARAVVGLANEYGVFMLRNALALAIAMGKEDGDRGF